jgi:hypothetical protein
MIIFLLLSALLSFEAVCSFNTVYAAARGKQPWRYTQWADANFIGWFGKLKWGVFYYLIMIALMVCYTFGMGVIESWLLFFMAIIYGFTTLFAWIVLARKSEHKQVQVQMNAIGPQGGMTPPPIPQ